jgi:hypothetical protein
VALLHYPVLNKNGETIASAVTNLDVHDIARASKTFGVRGYYVITPLDDQRALVDQIVDHWLNGFGAEYNPKRGEALSLVRVRSSYAEAVEDIRKETGQHPVTVATSARENSRSIRYSDLREKLSGGKPHLLVLGTAWGMAETFLEEADHILAPVRGASDYNHLSVRSAAAVILDRLLG